MKLWQNSNLPDLEKPEKMWILVFLIKSSTMNQRPVRQKYRIRFTQFILLWGFALTVSAQQPNILVIFSDDLNTNIGPYMGINNHTPNLDRLAREGVRFSRAYCQYPLCGPSRASIMSG